MVHERKSQVLEAMIRKSKGKSLVVNAKFNSTPLKAIIDTAAMLTLVNKKHVETQSENHEVVKLKGIGGHTIMGFKLCKQKIQIGALSFTWDCCAVAMNDDIIIGLDFLEAHHGIVNLNNKTLSLNGCLVPTELSKDEESFARRISRVTLLSSQVIPPNTILNIPVTLEQSLPKDYIVQPVQDSTGILGSTILGRGKQTFMQFYCLSMTPTSVLSCPVASVLALQR